MIGIDILPTEGQEGTFQGIEMYCVCLGLDEGFMDVYICQNSNYILKSSAVYSKMKKGNENGIFVKYQRPRIDSRLWPTEEKKRKQQNSLWGIQLQSSSTIEIDDQ